MADLRLMTPEEMRGSRNPAANEKTDILKTPREYGVPFLQKMYRQLYNDCFGRMFDGFPEMVDFTFSDSEEYLGRFICEHEEARDAQGRLMKFGYRDPKIDFSNSFDLSPYELANVMAHEMIHLAQVVWAAGEGMKYLEGSGDIDATLGHGEFFDTLADTVNSKLDLAVTAVCDDPTLKAQGKTNHAVDPVFFVVRAAGTDKCAVISVPEAYINQYVKKLMSENQKMRIYRCVDANFIGTYGCDAPDKGKKSIVPLQLVHSYIASGVLGDYTDEILDGLAKQVAEENAADSQSGTGDGRALYLLVMEHPKVGLVQMWGGPESLDDDAKEFAATQGVPVYVYEIKNPNDPRVQEGPADSGMISAAVRDGIIEPMHVMLPNGCQMQISL